MAQSVFIETLVGFAPRARRRNARSSSASVRRFGPCEEMKGANNRTPPFASFRTYVRGGVRAPQHDPQSVEGIVREAHRDAGHSFVGALAVDVLDAVAPRHECHDRPETRRGRRGRGARRALSGAPVAARGGRVVVVVVRYGFPRRPERLPGVPRASHAPRLRHGAEATAGAFSRTPDIHRVGAEFLRLAGDAARIGLRGNNFRTRSPYRGAPLFALTKNEKQLRF